MSVRQHILFPYPVGSCPLLTSVVANVATLVAGTTGKQHLDGILKLDTHSVSHEHELFWQIRVVSSVPLLSLSLSFSISTVVNGRFAHALSSPSTNPIRFH